MPKTIQIRDVDDAVYAGLAKRAAEAGLTVPELLRREAARIVSRPTLDGLVHKLEEEGLSPGRGAHAPSSRGPPSSQARACSASAGPK